MPIIPGNPFECTMPSNAGNPLSPGIFTANDLPADVWDPIEYTMPLSEEFPCFNDAVLANNMLMDTSSFSEGAAFSNGTIAASGMPFSVERGPMQTMSLQHETFHFNGAHAQAGISTKSQTQVVDNALQNSSVFIDESPWFHFDEEINSPAISRPDTNGSPPGSDPSIIQGSANGLDIPFSGLSSSPSQPDLFINPASANGHGIPSSDPTSSPSRWDISGIQGNIDGIGIPYSGPTSSPSGWAHSSIQENINGIDILHSGLTGSLSGSELSISPGSASGLDIPYSDSTGSSSKSDLSVIQRSGRRFGIPYSGLTSSPSGSDHFPVSRSANGIEIPYFGSASSSSSSDPSVDPRGITAKDANSAKKRQRSLVPFDRINRARQLPPLPVYEVKLSKKTPGQQRGLLWLTYDAKKKFDEDLAMLLARWGGVGLGHEGTCVLCPGDWSSAKPSSLQGVQTVAQLPLQTSARKLFQYSDHTTTFARAIVWFAEDTWPRYASELNNFLDCGYYKPKDASHRCHQEHCIVPNHLVYETSDVNADRNECCREAEKLRQERKDIPPYCTQHSPPCLLQVSQGCLLDLLLLI